MNKLDRLSLGVPDKGVNQETYLRYLASGGAAYDGLGWRSYLISEKMREYGDTFLAVKKNVAQDLNFKVYWLLNDGLISEDRGWVCRTYKKSPVCGVLLGAGIILAHLFVQIPYVSLRMSLSYISKGKSKDKIKNEVTIKKEKNTGDKMIDDVVG